MSSNTVNGTGAGITDPVAFKTALEIPAINNFAASAPPDNFNDISQGYTVGSKWFDTVGKESYFCISPTEGSAEWIKSTLTADELGSSAFVDSENLPISEATQLALNDKETPEGAQSKADAAEAAAFASLQAAIASHTLAPDPHGDRAYSDSQLALETTSRQAADGVLAADIATETSAREALAASLGTAATVDVGTNEGEVALLGVGGKYPESFLPPLSLATSLDYPPVNADVTLYTSNQNPYRPSLPGGIGVIGDLVPVPALSIWENENYTLRTITGGFELEHVIYGKVASTQAPTPSELIARNAGVSAASRADGPYSVGNLIQVGSSDVTINALGLNDSGATINLLASSNVSIWTADGSTQLATVTIPANLAGTTPLNGYRYIPLAADLVLAANTQYIIGADAGAGIEPFADGDSVAAFSGTAGISLVDSRFGAVGTFPNSAAGGAVGRWAPANAAYIPAPYTPPTTPDEGTFVYEPGFEGAPVTFTEATRAKTTGQLAINTTTNAIYINRGDDTNPDWQKSALTPEQVINLIAAETGQRVAADIESRLEATGAKAPNNVSGLIAWVDASTITGIADGAALDIWGDLSGNEHDFTASGSDRPTFIANSYEGYPGVRFNGTNFTGNFMTTGDIGSPFNESGTIIAVLRPNGATPGYAVGGVVSSGSLGVGSISANEDTAQAIGSRFSSRSHPGGLLPVPKMISMRWSGTVCYTAFNGQPFIWNDPNTASPITLTGGLTLGTSNNGTSFHKGDIWEVAVYDRALTAAEVRSVEKHLASKYNSFNAPVIVPIGDSITRGFGAFPGSAYGKHLNDNLGNGYEVLISGTDGRLITTAITDAPDRIDAVRRKGVDNILLVNWGTTVLAQGISAATAHADLKSYCLGRRKTGARIIVGTCMDRTSWLSGSDAVRATYNSLIYSNWKTYADGIMDFSNDPVMGGVGAAENTTYFGDGLHPTDAGYRRMAQIAAEAVRILRGVPTHTIIAPGTTGSVTLLAKSGRVNFAAGTTSLVVTNYLCRADSIIEVSLASNDATARDLRVVASNGFFTIYLGTSPTGECAVNFSLR